MNDRDSLMELYEIVRKETEDGHLPMAAAAMPFVKAHFKCGCNIYYRRRLSVCRMLIGLHLPLGPAMLDTLLAVVLSHSLPGDRVPEDHMPEMQALFACDAEVARILSVLNYQGQDYYDRLMEDRYALLVRLTERGVLVESLYEWPAADALRYIRETREHFFSMCIYAKEHYRELLGPVSILMEKTRNLVIVNEALIHRYDEGENALRSEILATLEENAALRAAIQEITGTTAF